MLGFWSPYYLQWWSRPVAPSWYHIQCATRQQHCASPSPWWYRGCCHTQAFSWSLCSRTWCNASLTPFRHQWTSFFFWFNSKANSQSDSIDFWEKTNMPDCSLVSQMGLCCCTCATWLSFKQIMRTFLKALLSLSLHLASFSQRLCRTLLWTDWHPLPFNPQFWPAATCSLTWYRIEQQTYVSEQSVLAWWASLHHPLHMALKWPWFFFTHTPSPSPTPPHLHSHLKFEEDLESCWWQVVTPHTTMS